MRAGGHTSRNAAKTYCDHGHEFTPENTYIDAGGWRQCRQCQRDRSNRHRMENREKVLAHRRELRGRVVYEPRTCESEGCPNTFVPARSTRSGLCDECRKDERRKYHQEYMRRRRKGRADAN